jgi:hypothetical protein
VLSGRFPEALRSAEAATNDLPRGSADWIRAQDIAMQARAAVERKKRKK